MEPELVSKLEMKDDDTDEKIEITYEKEEIKTIESDEAENENPKSFGISPSKNSVLSSAGSSKDSRKSPSEDIIEQHLNAEDAAYSDTMSTRKELYDINLSRPLNRQDVIEYCRNFILERKQLMLKNILLQKKLHDYFKKKKAEGMYVEGNSILDGLEESQAESLYQKNLSAFEDVLDKSADEKAKMDLKSTELSQRWKESLNNAAEGVDSLLKAEETYGNGLVKCTSGKILQEKEVLFLVNRHKEVIAELTLVLLKYIRVRDALLEKEAALKSLEDLGEGLSLINYEILNMEKLDLQNSIEERNAALDHFHGKIEAALVALSHFKEKISSCAEMMEKDLQQLDESNYLLRMNQDKRALAKKRSIELRKEIKNLQHKAGLLVHHSLLRDYDDATLQVDDLKCQIDEFKKKLKILQSKKDKKLTQKSNYENLNHTLSQKTSNDMSEENNLKKQSQKSTGTHGKIFKGRPSIESILQM